MHLTTCIKPDLTACALQYTFEHLAMDPQTTLERKLSYGLSCSDYLDVHDKVAMCGSVPLGSVHTVSTPIKGRLGLTMHTDVINNYKQDVGFKLQYKFLHDCNNYGSI